MTKPGACLSPLLDLVYPPYCLRCYHALFNETSKIICPECLSSVAQIRHNWSDICRKCGMFLGPHSGSRDDCPDCRMRHFPFRRNLAFGRYDGTLRDLILIYKYGREVALAEMLGGWLAERLKNEPEIIKQLDLIIPVPLTKAKYKLRGFNQSELLARALGKEFGIGIATGNLIRLKETPAQAGLSRAERINNLKDAFQVRSPEELRGKTLLLVDDVLTTGATAGEITRLLKDAGARSVYVLVLAR